MAFLVVTLFPKFLTFSSHALYQQGASKKKRSFWWKRSFCFYYFRSRRRRCSVKKVFLENSQNSQENTCARKETLAQVFSCEFCEISKNTFLYRTPLVAASVIWSTKRTNKKPLQLSFEVLYKSKRKKEKVRKYSFHRALFAELLFSFLFLHINFVLIKKDCISIKCHIKTLSFRFKCLKSITTLHNRLAVAGTYLIFLNIFLVNAPKNKSFLAFYGVRNGNIG